MGQKVLKHIGMPRRSGRYPWGSGDDPNQSSISFRSHVQNLREKGLSDVDIAKAEGITTTQLRAKMSLAKAEKRQSDTAEVIRLKEHGYSNMEIGRRMGINESSVRSLLNPVLAERAAVTQATSQMLKESVDSKRFIDIGAGVESHLGISRTKLNTAVAELEEQGYQVHRVNVEQLGMPGQFTIVKVLGAPDTTWKEVVKDVGKIQSITSKSDDYGRTYTDPNTKPIQSIDSKRVKVNFSEEGGSAKDGVIELRRGIKDLDLGPSKYAQVRISVDGTHYLKGMAIYSDKMPDGIDVMFNTNKSQEVGKMGALKKMKTSKDENGNERIDPDMPFGATIKDKRGALNIVNEEGDWAKWSKTISSQVLSKQTVPLAKSQLGLALKQKQEEYEEIMKLTNPVVKKQLLLAFGDDCDSSAVHLKAAALPRQASKVILPIPDLKPNEVYAPSFNNGESVVLIRHPHGGTFEIPELIVNNKSKSAKAIMENATDAIGIHPKVASKLSGADFDGDAVIVIPNNKGSVKTSASLKGLENFDPIESYRIPKDSNIQPIKPKTKQTKMGEISNLITDMTIKGATQDELARAVRHSMVVIDSEKHNLDYRQSYIDHGIAALSERYQNTKRGGASTLVSKASSELRVDARKPRSVAEGGPIDPKTGEKVYTKTGESYTDSKGRTVYKKIASTKMGEAKNAFDLSSGRPIEKVYAEYANNLKSLGNDARKNALKTIPTPYNASARKVYANEVNTLTASLNAALMNKPIERQAQIIANTAVAKKRQANPDMDHDEIKKLKNHELAQARTRTGANKYDITISDKEWAAIQAGAVSPSKLAQILQNTNLDHIKQLATPRSTTSLSPSKVSRAKAMLEAGYTQAEIAEHLGISTSTLNTSLK